MKHETVESTHEMKRITDWWNNLDDANKSETIIVIVVILLALMYGHAPAGCTAYVNTFDGPECTSYEDAQ
jgi:hypothetical protein